MFSCFYSLPSQFLCLSSNSSTKKSKLDGTTWISYWLQQNKWLQNLATSDKKRNTYYFTQFLQIRDWKLAWLSGSDSEPLVSLGCCHLNAGLGLGDPCPRWLKPTAVGWRLQFLTTWNSPRAAWLFSWHCSWLPPEWVSREKERKAEASMSLTA